MVNTCGFLASACEEAIDHVLALAELKRAGSLKKILVTGCMAQRYQADVLEELPEIDGILGTGSYGDIVQSISEVMETDLRPCRLGNIHTAPKTAPASSPRPPGTPTSALRRAVTTTAPTASSPPSGASTAAAPWRSSWMRRRS